MGRNKWGWVRHVHDRKVPRKWGYTSRRRQDEDKRFRGGSAKDWITSSMKFKSSRKEKAGVADQLTFQLLMLIDGDLLRGWVHRHQIFRNRTHISRVLPWGRLSSIYSRLQLRLGWRAMDSEQAPRQNSATLLGFCENLRKCTPSCPRRHKPSRIFSNVATCAKLCLQTGKTSSL